MLLLGAILFGWGKGNEEKRFSIRTEEGLEKDESDLADWTEDYKEGVRKPIILMYDKVVLIMVKLLEKGYYDFLSISWLRSFFIPTYLDVKSTPSESS